MNSHALITPENGLAFFFFERLFELNQLSKFDCSVVEQLTKEYGKGWSDKQLRRMMQFATIFADEQIVVSMIRQLTWTHLIAIFPIIGLILYSGKKQELIELLELNKSGIRVAEYLTELPPKKLLEEKLAKAIQLAKNKLDKVALTSFV